MAQTSWPFENVDTTETQFSQMFRNMGEGVKGSASTTDLKPFGDGSGMQVKVYAGQALVRGIYYSSTATETLALAYAHATLGRIDSVVLELDPSANSILLKVLTGTPASTPVAPTLTQTDAGVWQQLLGTVTVAAATSSITSGNVADTRLFIGPSAVSAGVVVTGTSDKSANYTLVAADKNTFIRSTGSEITITVPDVLANGESVNFVQAGSGQITFAGSSITLNSADSLLKTAKQFAGATVTKVGGAYYLVGNLG
jgi:hypothetical protein